MTARTSTKARSLGFRSMSEHRVAADLKRRGQPCRYEDTKLKYTTPASKHTYTPDFTLREGVYVEVKGRFTAADRRKLLLVKEQNPEIDIRLVFDRPFAPIAKGLRTTNALWCDVHGFLWAEKVVPDSWL